MSTTVPTPVLDGLDGESRAIAERVQAAIDQAAADRDWATLDRVEALLTRIAEPAVPPACPSWCTACAPGMDPGAAMHRAEIGSFTVPGVFLNTRDTIRVILERFESTLPGKSEPHAIRLERHLENGQVGNLIEVDAAGAVELARLLTAATALIGGAK